MRAGWFRLSFRAGAVAFRKVARARPSSQGVCQIPDKRGSEPCKGVRPAQLKPCAHAAWPSSMTRSNPSSGVTGEIFAEIEGAYSDPEFDRSCSWQAARLTGLEREIKFALPV